MLNLQVATTYEGLQAFQSALGSLLTDVSGVCRSHSQPPSPFLSPTVETGKSPFWLWV